MTSTQRSRKGIYGFLVAGLVAIGLGLLTGVGTASAHAALLDASLDCQNVVHYTATSWTTGPSGENPDVEIFYMVDNTGPMVVVAHGAFTAANNYTFSGTFNWPSGATLVVAYARAVGQWGDGITIENDDWNVWLRPTCTETSASTTTSTTTVITEPPVTDGTTVVTDDSTTTTKVESGGPTTTTIGSGGGGLPSTGTSSRSLVFTATGMLSLGVSAVLAARRRRTA